MTLLFSSPSVAWHSSSSRTDVVCRASQRGCATRSELNQRVLKRTSTQKRPKEVNLEHLRELSEKYKAQVPFHPLNHQDDQKLPQSILDKADHDLVEYCNALPGDETSERCWNAVRYFEERKSEAEEGCLIDEGGREWGSAQCSSLERLEDFVRQFVGQAPTHMFVKTLLVLEAADKRAAKQASSAGVAEGGSEVEQQAMSEVAERRQRLVDLFYAMDTDLNGMLDVEEFREAMRKADHDLSGSVVSKVLESMDVHGRLTLEEFLAIADAEEIYANTPLAKWMRRSFSDL